MSYLTWQEALAGLVSEKGLQDTELGDISRIASANGYRGLNGPVGALGHLTHVSEILAQARIDACTTRVDGSNTFQGRLLGISSRWREDGVVVYTLTASFDSRTSSRLGESLCGDHGMLGTDGAEYSLTIVREGPLST